MRSVDLTDPALVVAAVSLLIALLGILIGLRARRALAAVRKSTDILTADGTGHSLTDVVAARTEDVLRLQSAVDTLSNRLDATRLELSAALRHVSVVRYDAFGDMGGRMSFSTALLDDNADGLLITSIHGRSETRTYMKPVVNGRGDQISPEEAQAINQAMGRS